MNPILQNSTDEPISAEKAEALLSVIKEKKWWQGSLISGNDLAKIDHSYDQSKWWIIASQTCNLYNSSFENVCVCELIAAINIEECDAGKIRGDNPRILHLEAQSEEKVISLEINIQIRKWLPRQLLAELPAPVFHVRDAAKSIGSDWPKKQWMDKFVGWLASSYTRVALPNAFNDALKKSKLKDILEKKLTRNKDDLYGIYFSLDWDSDDQWNGVLGEMPPPYLLNIVLVVYENIDPELIKKRLLEKIFNENIPDPENTSQKITRAQLARRHQIRLIEADIEALSIAEISLLRLKSLIRYSQVDYLSDASVVTT